MAGCFSDWRWLSSYADGWPQTTPQLLLLTWQITAGCLLMPAADCRAPDADRAPLPHGQGKCLARPAAGYLDEPMRSLLQDALKRLAQAFDQVAKSPSTAKEARTRTQQLKEKSEHAHELYGKVGSCGSFDGCDSCSEFVDAALDLPCAFVPTGTVGPCEQSIGNGQGCQVVG